MKMVLKSLLLGSIVSVVAGSAVAATANATEGHLLMNVGQNTYTTTDPTGCAGVTFPTKVEPNSNQVVTVVPSKMTSNVCTTTYTNSLSGSCIVTVRYDDAQARTKLYGASVPLNSMVCSSINDKTDVVLN